MILQNKIRNSQEDLWRYRPNYLKDNPANIQNSKEIKLQDQNAMAELKHIGDNKECK